MKKYKNCSTGEVKDSSEVVGCMLQSGQWEEFDPDWDARDETITFYMEELSKANNRLLNAFQLVKNGKKIGYLKFDQFCLMLDQKRDHEGNLST